jgi:hypothetical protein
MRGERRLEAAPFRRGIQERVALDRELAHRPLHINGELVVAGTARVSLAIRSAMRFT